MERDLAMGPELEKNDFVKNTDFRDLSRATLKYKFRQDDTLKRLLS